MSTSTATPGYVRPVNKTFLFLHPALMSCITWPFSKEQNEKRERRSTQTLKNKSYSSNSKNKTGLSHSLALLLFSLKIWLGETPVENSFPLSLRRQKTGDFSVLRLPSSLAAVGLFLLGWRGHVVRVAVDSWNRRRAGFKPGESDAAAGALGGILTDDLADLPRPAFLQLGEDAGLEGQRGDSEEKLIHVFP